MRRSTVLSLSLQLVFPDESIICFKGILKSQDSRQLPSSQDKSAASFFRQVASWCNEEPLNTLTLGFNTFNCVTNE